LTSNSDEVITLVRNNNPYTVIILFIFTLVVKLGSLAEPMLPEVPANHIAFAAVVQLFSYVLGKSAFGFTMLAVIMLFAQALYLNAICVKYKLYGRPAYVVAYLYLLLTSLYPPLNYFTVPLLVNWCLIAAIDILLGAHQASQPRKQVFNAGFALGIACLLHFPSVVYLVLLFLAISLLRSFNPGEWIVGLVGFFTAVYFFAGILFLFDAIDQMPSWLQFGFYSPAKPGTSGYTSFLITGVILLFGLGLFMLQSQITRISVFMRRNWTITAVCMTLSFIVIMATDNSISSSWLLLTPPLTMVAAHAFYVEKNKLFSNFALYFSLLLLVVCLLIFK
jgi:hypothetical protein